MFAPFYSFPPPTVSLSLLLSLGQVPYGPVILAFVSVHILALSHITMLVVGCYFICTSWANPGSYLLWFPTNPSKTIGPSSKP
jgi:hypothetical protein